VIEQSLIDFVPHPAALIDESGVVVAENAGFVRTFGSRFHGAMLTTALHEARGSSLSWIPRGTWTEDRVVLENGVQWGEVLIRTIPLDRYHSLFICTGNGHDEYHRVLAEHVRNRECVVTLLRSADHAVIVVDRAGIIRHHNEAAATLLRTTAKNREQYGVDHRSGLLLDEVLELRQNGVSLRPMTLVSQGLEHHRDARFAAGMVVVDREGFPQEIEISVYPMTATLAEDTVDEEECAVVTLRNVGEARRIRSDLRYLQHAENVTRAASGLAHELIDGCTALYGQIDLLHQKTEADLSTLHTVVRRIQRLGYRMAGFSGDVADEALEPDTTEEPNEQDTARGTLRVEETIIDAVDLALSGTSIRATFSIADSVRPVAVPAHLLSQVVFNLATNAVEAMHDGGNLHVDALVPRGESVLKVSVRDEGHGMDPRILSEVTKPYFTTKDRGIGMGLTVSSSILEERGGSLTIVTDPGFGTTVNLFIPLLDQPVSRARGAQGKHREERKEQPASAGRKREEVVGANVLLVEDDLLVRRSMERSLRTLGCNVTTVENGEKALPLLKDRIENGSGFNLLITDLTMPGRLDGVQLLRRARELDPDLPAILSSGTLHAHRGAPYREAGFQAVLRKPFGLEQLRRSIMAVLQVV
jgi:signal transduction histidine kinase